MHVRIRLVLLFQAASFAAASAALLLGVGMPLVAARAMSPRAFGALVALDAIALAALGAFVLVRWVGRPVERLLTAADGLSGRPDGFPLVGPEHGAGAGFTGAAVAFERLVAALGEERARLAAKVVELEAANQRLAETRASLLRSERLATVGRLAAGVAHEVGNPLGAIAGYADLARARMARGSSVEADKFLGRIVEETQRIDAIVRDLLDFARPGPARIGPVDVGAVVDDATRIARLQPRFRAVEVKVEASPDVPAAAADPRQLSQVVLNLLLNAADAMDGRGAVRVTLRSGPAGRVLLEVTDGGPGFPSEDLPRVFDPFFTTKPPGRGAGLGLAVCHGIVASFGGEITASNVPGGGARVTVSLPAAPAATGGGAPEQC